MPSRDVHEYVMSWLAQLVFCNGDIGCYIMNLLCYILELKYNENIMLYRMDILLYHEDSEGISVVD